MDKKQVIFLVLSFLLMASALLAQEKDEQLYNPNSVNPVRTHDQMFKKGLWFRMDLRQKANVGFYADNNELTKIIIDAVKSGVIQPFENDSLNNRMTYTQFLENLRMPNAGGEVDDEGFADDNDAVWVADGTEGKKSADGASAKPSAPEYFPRDMFIVEIREDMIFDSRRSRMTHDLQAITIIIPHTKTPTGIEKVVASFSYKELVEKVFRNNPKAIWYNMQNSAEHRNLEDAFTLRLFDAIIWKYENPKNNTIMDMARNGREALQLSNKILFELMEFEANLWSN